MRPNGNLYAMPMIDTIDTIDIGGDNQNMLSFTYTTSSG